jgi:hypothetical protein
VCKENGSKWKVLIFSISVTARHQNELVRVLSVRLTENPKTNSSSAKKQSIMAPTSRLQDPLCFFGDRAGENNQVRAPRRF